MKDAFVAFANRVPFYGVVVACLDHPHVQDILPRIDKRIATYGLAAQADYRARNPVVKGLATSFEVLRRGELLGDFEVRMPGIHNVLNALATIAVADELDGRPGQGEVGARELHRRAAPLHHRRRARSVSQSSTTTAITRPKFR